MNSKENIIPSAGGARVPADLLAAMDMAGEAETLTNAILMACSGIGQRDERDAMIHLVGMALSSVRSARERLDVVAANGQQGGAA